MGSSKTIWACACTCSTKNAVLNTNSHTDINNKWNATFSQQKIISSKFSVIVFSWSGSQAAIVTDQNHDKFAIVTFPCSFIAQSIKENAFSLCVFLKQHKAQIHTFTAFKILVYTHGEGWRYEKSVQDKTMTPMKKPRTAQSQQQTMKEKKYRSSSDKLFFSHSLLSERQGKAQRKWTKHSWYRVHNSTQPRKLI